MGKLTLITGSANSGKSEWAVSCFDSCDNIQYLCTSPKLDRDTMNKIIYAESSHNVCCDLRCNFRFEEPPNDLADYDNFIIDSINDFARRFSTEIRRSNEEAERYILQITELARKIKAAGGNAVVVTEETGFIPNFLGGKAVKYKNFLCTVNRRLAEIVDEVYFSASGVQFRIK